MVLSWVEPRFGLSEQDIRRTTRGRQTNAAGAPLWFSGGSLEFDIRSSQGDPTGVMGLALARVGDILRPLMALPANWDSYGGRALTRRGAEYAYQLVVPLIVQGVPAPSFVPMSEGGVSLEWHLPSAHLVIQIPAEPDIEPPSVFFRDPSGQWEADLAESIPRVSGALARFMQGPGL